MDERNNYDTLLSNEEEVKPSFGKQLVGLSFNPSGDPKITKVKELCAELADITYEHWCRDAYSEKSNMENQLYNHTVGEILNAQMNIVKLLSFKY
jgi:hypothetical protein